MVDFLRLGIAKFHFSGDHQLQIFSAAQGAADGKRRPQAMGDESVTLLLEQWRQGDSNALGRIIPLVYSELRSIASRELRRESQVTLQPTAVVHEAYCKLAGQRPKNWKNRSHFLAVCAQILRQVLVDHARERKAARRNSGYRPVTLVDELDGLPPGSDVTDLDDALRALEQLDPFKAKVVVLRYFGGLEVPEVAQALDCSTATVKRHWALAKAFLYEQLTSGRHK
jgi:RNA polymerase sigma-70 factor, ECF subfamily